MFHGSVHRYLFWTEQKRLPAIKPLGAHWWEPAWPGIRPPASVQSQGVHIVSLLHYSWEHWEDMIQASDLHRDTYPARAQLHGEHLARGALQSLYSRPAVLPRTGLPSLFLILERLKLHAHPRESISALTAAFSSRLSKRTPVPSHGHTAHTPPTSILSRLRVFVGGVLC